MQQSMVDEEKVRNTLKAKRKLLFLHFSENPLNTRLALEIRLLDDLISNLERNHRERMKEWGPMRA